MLLYICPTCGHWQDQSITVALGNAFAAMAQALTGNNPVQTPATTVECPECHVAMTQVQPTDKLSIVAATPASTDLLMQFWREVVNKKNEDETK